MNGYDTYYYAVHDKMNSALTFVPDSVKVKIGSMTLQKDTDYRVVTEGIDDGETFQIQIMDLKAVITGITTVMKQGANRKLKKYMVKRF